MKKLVSILTTLVLALQLTTVSAASVTTGTPTMTVNAGEIGDDGKFVVTLDMAGVNYWSYICVQVDFDGTAMQLSKPAQSNVIGYDVWEDTGASVSFQKSASFKDVPQNLSWNSPYGTCTYSGTMATLTFKLLEGAVPGKTYPITVKSYYGPSNDQIEGVDINFWKNVSADEELDMCPVGQKVPLNFTYVSDSIKIPGGAVETTLKATKADNTVSITATGEEITGKFIVAAYKGNELAEVIVKDAKASETATITAEYTKVKVMWWDSLTGLTSIAPAVEL